ncbi:unnamed protein product [Oppiella nova]|uniref:Uncharacterized protein n=1 Tax=Oppiella nova TaxID=334625 RepID=A0A7R9QN81_9ACAR|nr:unnamed protein product [Oppiella nova]CAG2168354.1 unnamed protein product [Oppiella nova]
MKMQIILSVLMALICVKVNGQTTHKSTVSPPHEFKCMKEFYQKYCAEKDDNVFKQLEKCEHKNPKEIKDIEIHCVEKIRKAAGKTGELTHLEYQALECDAKLGEEVRHRHT